MRGEGGGGNGEGGKIKQTMGCIENKCIIIIVTHMHYESIMKNETMLFNMYRDG